jgi:nucleoside-diphosphate-sugar epimerase
MRVFLAGATGVIGLRLVPLLIAAGHDVAGMTRTHTKAGQLTSIGAEPVVCDVFDLNALREAVAKFGPEVVLHELTDLPEDRARIPELGALNSRMRREGTANLVAAAKAAGTPQFVAQSVAWTIPGDGGAAVEEHERAVLDAGGVVIRYGQFYGPGTYFPSEVPPPPRVHIDDAARRTLPALSAPPGVRVVTEPTMAESHL